MAVLVFFLNLSIRRQSFIGAEISIRMAPRSSIAAPAIFSGCSLGRLGDGSSPVDPGAKHWWGVCRAKAVHRQGRSQKFHLVV